jgi:hypothetical protein
MLWFTLAPAQMFFVTGALTAAFAAREAGLSAPWQVGLAAVLLAAAAVDVSLLLAAERGLPSSPPLEQIRAARPDVALIMRAPGDRPFAQCGTSHQHKVSTRDGHTVRAGACRAIRAAAATRASARRTRAVAQPSSSIPTAGAILKKIARMR